LGEEDRLVIAEDDFIKKESPNNFQMESSKKGKVKQRKKQNRFNGLTEEELSKRLLPDLLVPDLDILIVRFLGFFFP
jgi:TDG/mug DNA glycosylase family protein